MNEPASERFYNITMTGRLCYIFMCIERYLTTLYPERDWTPEAPGEKERGRGEFENTEYLSVILNKKAGGKCP